MKRLFGKIALAALVVAFASITVACGGSAPTAPSTTATTVSVAAQPSTSVTLRADGAVITASSGLPYTVGVLVAEGDIVRPAGDNSKITVTAGIYFAQMDDVVVKSAKDYPPQQDGVVTMNGDHWTWTSKNYTPCVYPFFNGASPTVDCHTKSTGFKVTLTINDGTLPSVVLNTDLARVLIPTK